MPVLSMSRHWHAPVHANGVKTELMNIHTHIAPPLHVYQKPNRQTHYLLCKSNGLSAQLVPSLLNLQQLFAHGVSISFHARLATVEPHLKSAQGWKLCSLAF